MATIFDEDGNDVARSLPDEQIHPGAVATEQAARLIPVPPEHWKSAAAHQRYTLDGLPLGWTVVVGWERRIDVPQMEMFDVGDGLASTEVHTCPEWREAWAVADALNAFIASSKMLTHGTRNEQHR